MVGLLGDEVAGFEGADTVRASGWGERRMLAIEVVVKQVEEEW